MDELKNLVQGKGIYAGIDDYLLLITSEGFLEEKIGNNFAYETVDDALNGNGPTPENQGLDGIELDSDGYTDTVSGCTIKIDALYEALEDALNQAKK